MPKPKKHTKNKKKKSNVSKKKKYANKNKNGISVKKKTIKNPKKKSSKNGKSYKKQVNKRYFQVLIIIVLVFSLYGGILYYIKNNNNADLDIIPSINTEQEDEEQIKKLKKEEDYKNCLRREFDERDYTVNLLNMKQDISNYIINSKYQASIYYEDLTTGFNYTYKPSTVYYGCSLIKLVDALYLINKAIDGSIDLDNVTITYTANYKASDSLGMQTRKIGEKVTLRDLITYAISVSDNTAHFMLIDYIGFNNLQAYGRSLGAKVILTGGDKFGNQTASDTNIYLKEAYRIIRDNEEYGPFLKEIMGNDVRNSFNTVDIKIYHKYGSYGINYHDIGLSLEENPYAISILTLHEERNYVEVVQNIHNKIRELHNAFYENRKEICYKEVYEKEN